MNPQVPLPPDAESRRVRAEAAAWIARMHGPDRNPDSEAGLRRWLAEHPAHAEAFELATEAWEDSSHLPGSLPGRMPAARPPARSRRILRPAAAIAISLLLATVYYFANSGVTTGVGEQRTLNLADGTRVELNTNTRLAVEYDRRERRVVLKEGEAFFDVAKHEERPFVVVAGERKIIAVGTSFLVRREEPASTALTVTLIEGRVAVAPIGFSDKLPLQPTPEVTVMSAGQRLTLQAGAQPTIDLPAMDKVTGWRHGHLIFEDTPLREAVAELNRYSPMRIVPGSAEIGEIRVGGVFRIGDSASFARVVADAHRLVLVERGDTLLLDLATGMRDSAEGADAEATGR